MLWHLGNEIIISRSLQESCLIFLDFTCVSDLLLSLSPISNWLWTIVWNTTTEIPSFIGWALKWGIMWVQTFFQLVCEIFLLDFIRLSSLTRYLVKLQLCVASFALLELTFLFGLIVLALLSERYWCFRSAIQKHALVMKLANYSLVHKKNLESK